MSSELAAQIVFCILLALSVIALGFYCVDLSRQLKELRRDVRKKLDEHYGDIDRLTEHLGLRIVTYPERTVIEKAVNASESNQDNQ